MGNSLDLIIPEPFKSFHYKLTTPKYFTGKYFTCNRYRNMVCLSRLGYLKNFKLALRFNETISMELQYVAIMHFDLRSKVLEDQHCFMATDGEGNIKSMTKSARDIFQLETSIFQYGSQFKKIYEVSFYYNFGQSFNLIANRKINQKEIKGKYYKIMKDNKLKEAWEDYIIWSKPRTMRIITRFGESIKVRLKIQNRIIGQVNEITRFIILQNISTMKIFQELDLTHNFDRRKGAAEKKEERKNIESILCQGKKKKAGDNTLNSQGTYFDEEEDLKAETLRAFNNKSKITKCSNKEEKGDSFQEKKVGFLTERKKKRQVTFNFNQQINPRNNDSIVGPLYRPNEQIEEEESLNEELQALSIESYEINESLEINVEPSLKKNKIKVENYEKTQKNIHFRLSKLIHHNQNLCLTKSFFPSVSSKEKMLELVDSNANFTSSKTTSRVEKAKYKISKVQIKNNTRMHSSTKTALVFLILILMINLNCIFVKYPLQKKTQVEVPIALIALDIVCWITWVQLYGIINLEGNRAVRDGWIGEYDMKRFINNQSYWEGTYPLQSKSEVWIFAHIAEKECDKLVRKFQFLDIFKGYHKWVDDDINVDFYEIANSNEIVSENDPVDIKMNNGLISIDNTTKWFQVKMSRLDTMMLTTLAGEIYMSRNYQNDSLEVIPSLGESRDRNNDPFEDYFRKLLIREPLKAVAYRTWDIEEYLKDVCRQNEWSIVFSSLVGICSSTFLLILLIIYVLRVKFKMNDYYERLFSIKVRDSL